ncbi:MAG: Rpn family recombination-promoting nuclease/putative transposase [Fusobacteriaceae bacterium]
MCISLLDPKMDFIFKKIFGSENDKSILISFLNAALKTENPIVDVELRNVEITKEAIEDKNSRLDVKAVTDKGMIVNVEIQLSNQYNMTKRTLYYWSKLYSDQMKEGDNYSDLNKTVCINILNFIQFKNAENYHTVFKIKEKRENFILDDAFEIHFLELPKLKIYDVEDPLTGWGMFLKEPSSDMVEDAEEAIHEIKNAKKKLYVISADEDERERYRMREKGRLDAQSALAEAIEKGIEKGKKEAKLQLAKSLIGLLPDEIIAEKTELSLEEIKNLKN